MGILFARAMILGAFAGVAVAASILGVFKIFGVTGGRTNNIGPVLMAVFVFEPLAIGVLGNVFSNDSIYFYAFTFLVFLGVVLNYASKKISWVKELSDKRLLEQCFVFSIFGFIALVITGIKFSLGK